MPCWTLLPQAQSWQVADRAQLNHALNLASEADGHVVLAEQDLPELLRSVTRAL